MKKERTKRQKWIQFLSIALLTSAFFFLVMLGKAYYLGAFRSVESLQVYISRFGSFGPLFLSVFQAAQVVLPVLPGFLGYAAGSIMFGAFIGFLCNYIGISAGSIIAFFLARRYGTPLIEDLFPSDRYKKRSSWAAGSRSYTAFLFIAMLLPLFPDDFLCYFSGITEMKSKKFIWIIIIGKPWCILAYSLGFSLIK